MEPWGEPKPALQQAALLQTAWGAVLWNSVPRYLEIPEKKREELVCVIVTKGGTRANNAICQILPLIIRRCDPKQNEQCQSSV